MKIASEQVEGIGFAIPSNEVKVTIKELFEKGEVERPSIGIGLLNLSDIPEEYKKELETNRKDGVYVAKVDGDNGLKEGDIITKIDDQDVKEDTDLKSYLYQHKKPGDEVTITIERKGKTQTVDITLKELNTSKDSSKESNSSQSGDSSLMP